MRIQLAFLLFLAVVQTCSANEPVEPKPVELEAIQLSLGKWDAEIEIWPKGLESPSMIFQGVETNRAFGEYWLASDFDSIFGEETMSVHSIVGYDIDQKQLVGKVIDHGPYAASMKGDYDPPTKSITWLTEAKNIDGSPMFQKTVVTLVGKNKRHLVCSIRNEANEFIKCMEIRYTKQLQTSKQAE